MNRRDFIHPRRLAEAGGHVIGAIDELRSTGLHETPAGDIALVRFARPAMATTFEAFLPCGLPFAFAAAHEALDLVDSLEAQLTAFRDSSEVSRLNREAASRAVVVEEQLFELLSLAQRLTEETEGAFDITAGALTKTWGFFGRAGRVPSLAERQKVLAKTGMRHLTLDPQNSTVRYEVAGLEINLGSIGKGHALDRIAAYWRDNWNVPAALLHGGHSSVYAIGSEPGGLRGWKVGLRHPWDPEKRLGVVRLRDQGLGTSAATFQHLEYEGRKLGHILDPRTGWPAESLASASVVAASAAEADALATAFFIMGIDKARAYCEAHPQVGAVLLPTDAARPVVIGLAPDDIELA